jgi:Ca2+-dependent lipid-binding protein
MIYIFISLILIVLVAASYWIYAIRIYRNDVRKAAKKYDFEERDLYL